ncbi:MULTISPECIES: helix-turn-helix domain-containing protein [Streptomyces]|uniref:Helix-turn-helix domain-containing protein n=1 Tax=Streptomyces eurythermus TaxID=42237 RepID=A0ABW6Z3N1_9ACTN|nr:MULTISPECIES: helix-turn-helix domain-containing protein [Streptomyces]QIS75141.1 helix-turn-helix transcriptional regulator [Streptomyces sp. DSM 40868]
MTVPATAARAVVRALVPPTKSGHACEDGACREASVDDVVVGTILRAAREHARLSPGDAAACLGLREARIIRLETGRATWSPQHAVTLARRYGIPAEQVEELGELLAAEHDHAVPDLGADPGPRLAALEGQAVAIRVATRTVPPFVYGWGTKGTLLTGQPRPGMPTAPRPRPWPACPVTLLWEEYTLAWGYIDAATTAARLRHLAAMAGAGVLQFRILIPDYDTWFEPVGSELTLEHTTVCVEEHLYGVTYSNGPAAAWKKAALDRQLAAALSPEDSLAALHRAAERWARS